MTDVDLKEELAKRRVCIPLASGKTLRFGKTPGVLWDELDWGVLREGDSVKFFFRAGAASEIPPAAGTRKEDGTLPWPCRFDALGLDVFMPFFSLNAFTARLLVGDTQYVTPVGMMRAGAGQCSDDFFCPVHIMPLQFFSVFLDYKGGADQPPGRYGVRLRGINYVPVDGTIPQGEGTYL
jgi:hypothetical protein